MGDFWSRNMLCLCLFVVSDGMPKVHHGLKNETYSYDYLDGSPPPRYLGLTNEPSTQEPELEIGEIPPPKNLRNHNPEMVSRRHLGRRQLDNNFYGDEQQIWNWYDQIGGPETRPSDEMYDRLPQNDVSDNFPQRQMAYGLRLREPGGYLGYNVYKRPPRGGDFDGLRTEQSDISVYSRPPPRQDAYGYDLRAPERYPTYDIYDRPPQRGYFNSLRAHVLQERPDIVVYGRPPPEQIAYGYDLRASEGRPGYTVYGRSPQAGDSIRKHVPLEISDIGFYGNPPPRQGAYGLGVSAAGRDSGYGTYYRPPRNGDWNGLLAHVPQQRSGIDIDGGSPLRQGVDGHGWRVPEREPGYIVNDSPLQNEHLNGSRTQGSQDRSGNGVYGRPPQKLEAYGDGLPVPESDAGYIVNDSAYSTY